MHPVGFPDPFDSTLPPSQIVAVIPARYDSTRLPGKVLADIAGRPMVEHVYRRVAAARGVDAVVVATDDERVAAAVRSFGGIARMTRATHRTGTDRVAEVAADLSCGIVLNVQGDEPMIEPAMIEQVIAPLAADPAAVMSTVYCAIVDPSDHTDPNVVKVVSDRQGRALYFSRAPIPHLRDASGPPKGGHYPESPTGPLRDASGPPKGGHYPGSVVSGFSRTIKKHIGLYGYRRAFLLTLAALPQTPLELSESLEQLRALEHGYRIHAVETQHDSIGVDTPGDLDRVRRQMLAVPARS